MTIATFSLPIDIPWKRIAFSANMMDLVACDRRLPPRWNSSLAVFEYEPPEDQQRSDDFIVTYLKVSCTITGFQQDGQEIRIREWLGQSGWTNKEFKDKLGEDALKYYPCNGAILEVVVAPDPDDKHFGLRDYPYFADFDPKKRELYEVVTETGEVMSRSLEDVNVRLGQTTLQSHEVRDSTTLAGEIAGAYGNAQTGGQVSAKGSASNTSGTTDLSQQGTENVRTSDAAREARETFSHTTQLSQMYHQLDSYHLGTNRAAFFILPRPHTIQSPATFVNGPREIEGVQEFMLVVVRPKEMQTYCVEAYLETAHLTGKPIFDLGQSSVELVLPPCDAPVTEDDDRSYYENHVPGTATATAPVGKVVDMDRGAGGYDIVAYKAINLTKHTFDVAPDHVTVTGEAIGRWQDNKTGGDLFPAYLALTANVYLKSKVPEIVDHEPGLLITARAVCSCESAFEGRTGLDSPSVVYEKSLAKADTQEKREDNSMSIRDANQLGADLKREMLQSLSSSDRYPRGTVGLLDSQLLADMMGAHIRYGDRDVNPRLMDATGVDKKVARRVTAYDPAITRAQMLEMPLTQQVENFGLTFDEAVALRRALADLAAPKGSRPIPERPQIEMPLLIGLQLNEAQSALAAIGLSLGSRTVVDSPLPSGSIVAQEPPAGVTVEPMLDVSVQIASGSSVRLPEVIGLGLTDAVCHLRDAGLQSEPTIEGRSAPGTHVITLEPPAGTLVTPNTPVTISLRWSHHPSESDYR